MAKKRRKRRKIPGHYCWSCDCRRPNEKFSGKGHAKHLCKDCSKLSKDELAYRQAVRDIGRCFTWEGFLRKKKRSEFEKFLNSSISKIREYANDLMAEHREMAACQDEERSLEDEMAARWEKHYEEMMTAENEAIPTEPEFPTAEPEF